MQLIKTTFTVECFHDYEEKDNKVTKDETIVKVDGVQLALAPSLKIRNHSPDGFNWGYSGSGPAQTALAICLHIFKNDYIAAALYQRFKSQFVASWNGDEISVEIDLTDFLIDNRACYRRAQDDEQQDKEMGIKRQP